MGVKGQIAARVRAARNRRLVQHYEQAAMKPLGTSVLFESWRGKAIADSPRAIYEALLGLCAERGITDIEIVWAVNKGVDARLEPGSPARLVRRGTPEYLDALATCAVLVSNDAMDPAFPPLDRTHYIQTWHGTPLKKLALDIAREDHVQGPYLVNFLREVSTWDLLLVSNVHSADTFSRAFRYEGETMSCGSPRNDILFDRDRADRVRREMRARWGLAEGEVAVLYAPTWRDNRRDALGRYKPFGAQILPELGASMPAGHVLVYRGHHMVRGVGDPMPGVVDATAVPDMRDVLVSCDVLITDYSSVMFDWAIRDLPMILLVPDLEEYRDTVRGFYFDLFADPPGHVARTVPEVSAALADLARGEDPHAVARGMFKAEFCALDDGTAGAAVAREILRAMGRDA